MVGHSGGGKKKITPPATTQLFFFVAATVSGPCEWSYIEMFVFYIWTFFCVVAADPKKQLAWMLQSLYSLGVRNYNRENEKCEMLDLSCYLECKNLYYLLVQVIVKRKW